MPTQEVVSTILMPVQSTDVFLSAMAALVFCKPGPFDSIWNLTNRVCDRYLPQMRTSQTSAP